MLSFKLEHRGGHVRLGVRHLPDFLLISEIPSFFGELLREPPS